VLSYRHHFHAGNHADVLKHALLVRLLLALEKKEKPFRFLDTHAGAGLYDLHDERASKNREFESGIARLWGRGDAPAGLGPYLDAVRRENPDGALRYYPGSPRIARGLLRASDRMVVTDLNAAEAEELAQMFARDRQVVVERKDGYEALRAYLPPPQRRGLVLVDSGFDQAEEFSRLVAGLAEGYRRFGTGIFALWYPLMDPGSMRGFEAEVVATGIRRVLQLELEVRAEGEGLRGSGLLVVNPPWHFDDEARPILEWLTPVLAQDEGAASSVRWLVPE
jgi:23S rRNA (adenine2030-N6)-methyltransferase